MTIKKRGLGRGLEALLINVSTTEETLKTEMPKKNDESSHIDIKNELQELKKTVAIQSTQECNTLIKIVESTYNVSDDENCWRADSLLQEAENLRKLINEFEAMIRQN